MHTTNVDGAGDEALAVLMPHCTLLGPSWGCTAALSWCSMAHSRSLCGYSTAEPQRMPSLTRERQLVHPCWQLIWAEGRSLDEPRDCQPCGYNVTDSSFSPACSSYVQILRKPQCQHCACVLTLWRDPPLPAWGGPWSGPTRGQTPMEAPGLGPPPTRSLGWALPPVLAGRQ